MNTNEIEKLYIAHAADFRELLDSDPGSSIMAGMTDGTCIFHTNMPGVLGTFWPSNGHLKLSAALAVAAMTESWQEKAQREYGLVSTPQGWTWPTANCWYDSLPDAIVRLVSEKAAEKRAKAKTESKAAYLRRGRTIMGLSPATGPDLTATQQTRGAAGPQQFAAGPQQFIDAQIANDNRIRSIVQEELHAYHKPDPKAEPRGLGYKNTETSPAFTVALDPATGPDHIGVHCELNFLLDATTRLGQQIAHIFKLRIYKNHSMTEAGIKITKLVRKELGLPEWTEAGIKITKLVRKELGLPE